MCLEDKYGNEIYYYFYQKVNRPHLVANEGDIQVGKQHKKWKKLDLSRETK